MTSTSSLPQDRQSLAEGLRADALMEEDVAWSHEIDGERDGEQYDRSERARALRRVAGLSTELEDVTEVEYRQLRLERVVLVGVWTSGTVQEADNSLAELAALAETAGALVLDGVTQRRDKPDPATYIGSGKAQELRDIVLETGADTVVCDGELSPGQLIHLEDVVKVKVVDRTRADPRHLRPARQVPRGQGAGVPGADAVHAAEAARLGPVAVPADGRWRLRFVRRRHGHPWSR
ncbi:hypothetical protein GCM10020221_32740 [Streptomyces thioluteus]|uniref:GTPase HflX N-terminal domain-containing protein n=1 Tax=Streptomyces thioluteus TaxID=66431 RepID=A0ABN3X4E2_STRTU